MGLVEGGRLKREICASLKVNHVNRVKDVEEVSKAHIRSRTYMRASAIYVAGTGMRQR